MDALPGELSLALSAAGLDDAGILDSYPRDSYDVLVAAAVTGIDTAADGTLTGTGDDMDAALAASAGTSYFSIYLTVLNSLFVSLIYLFVVRRFSIVRLCSLSFPPVGFLLVARTDVSLNVSLWIQVRLWKIEGPRNTEQSRRAEGRRWRRSRAELEL